MKPKKNTDRKYEVTMYDGHEITVKTMTAEEIEALDPKDFDHFLSTASATWGYRTSSGKWVEHRIKWPGLGEVGLRVLRVLQLYAGDFISRKEIADLAGFESLTRHGVLSARIHAVRKAHGDKNQRFIETTRSNGFKARWPSERKWLWIDRIPTNGDESAD